MPEATYVNESDRLFTQPQQRVADFVSNEDVVRVFPDMIKCPVPGYLTIVENIGVFGAQFAQPNNILCGLGCSLDAVTQSPRYHIRNDGCRVVGVDNLHVITECCSEYLHARDVMYQELLPVELIEAGILALGLQPTSPAAASFTLQFVAPDRRLGLLRRTHQTLLPDGTLILSERPHSAGAQEHTLFTDLHIVSKHVSGYSELEIAQERSTLGNVVLPDTFKKHRGRLLATDFNQISQWFWCLNFVPMIALP